MPHQYENQESLWGKDPIATGLLTLERASHSHENEQKHSGRQQSEKRKSSPKDHRFKES